MSIKTITIFDTDIQVDLNSRKILTKSPYNIFITHNYNNVFNALDYDDFSQFFYKYNPKELFELTREVIKLQPQATEKINTFYMNHIIREYIGIYKNNFEKIPNNLMVSIPFNNIKIPWLYKESYLKDKLNNLVEIYEISDTTNIDIIKHFDNWYSKYGGNKCFKGYFFNLIDEKLNIISKMPKPEQKVITALIKCKNSDITLKMIKYWKLDPVKLFEKAIKGKDYSSLEILYPNLSKKLRVENWENMIRAIPGLIRSNCDPEIFNKISEIETIEWENFCYNPPEGKLMYATKSHPVDCLTNEVSSELIVFLKNIYPNKLNFDFIKIWMQKYLSDKNTFDETFFEIAELFRKTSI
jgi:hypothetical protein